MNVRIYVPARIITDNQVRVNTEANYNKVFRNTNKKNMDTAVTPPSRGLGNGPTANDLYNYSKNFIIGAASKIFSPSRKKSRNEQRNGKMLNTGQYCTPKEREHMQIPTKNSIEWTSNFKTEKGYLEKPTGL